MIWMSERDNWNHLYMYNRITAQPDYQITKGEWYVREVLRVDEDNRQIYFSANGMEAGEDPYLIRYYRIGFDGKGLTCLTPEEGMHRAWFSGDMKYLVDVYSMVDKVPVAVLRSARDGKSGDAVGNSRYNSFGGRRLESSGGVCCQRAGRQDGYVGIDCPSHQL